MIAAIAAGAAAAFNIGGSGVPLGRSVAEGSSGSSAAQADQGRWGRPTGPEGGWAFALAVDPANPETVYAGGWGNVFKSTNGGSTWRDMTTQPWTRVTALAIDPARPEVVYAGTDRGIAKTVDGGRRWQMMNGGLLDGTSKYPRRVFGEGFISSLVIDSGNPNVVYAITYIGLFRTTNGGAHWRIIGPPVFRKRTCDTCHAAGYGYSLAAAVDPDHGTLYASWARGRTPANLYESRDGGDSWRQVEIRGRVPSFGFLALDGDGSGTIFAANWSQRGVLKSTDGGTTWSVAGLPTHRIGAFAVDPGSRGTLYVSTQEGLFKTSDAGATWQTAPAKLAYGAVVSDPQDPGTVYGAGSEGVVKSLDSGSTWVAANTGLVSSLVESIVLAPGSSKILYAGTLDGPGLFKSTDGGGAWRVAGSGLEQTSVIALAVNARSPRTIYAGTRERGVFKSVDAGLTWKPVDTGLPSKFVTALAIDPRNATRVFAVVGSWISGTIFLTVDGGASWRPIARPGNVQAIALDAQTENTMYAGTKQGLYRSRDSGRSWQLVAHGARGTLNSFPAIAIAPSDSKNVYEEDRGRHREKHRRWRHMGCSEHRTD